MHGTDSKAWVYISVNRQTSQPLQHCQSDLERRAAGPSLRGDDHSPMRGRDSLAPAVSDGIEYELLRIRNRHGDETTVYLVRHPRGTPRGSR